MGYSMGGLVARYCLANMEKERRTAATAQNDHQARLLITLDSPHRGANVPLGFQFLLLDASNMGIGVPMPNQFNQLVLAQYVPALFQARSLLDAPATQQLLIYRALEFPRGIVRNTFLEGEYREMVTFPAGSPPPYRLIATSSGSECGTPVFAPHTELVRASGNFFISPLPWIHRSSWNTEIIANALPAAGTSARISSIKVWNERRILSLINIKAFVINRTFHNPTTTLPVDGAPGGTYPVREMAGNQVPSTLFSILPSIELRLDVTTLIDAFSFVPTVSAIDVTTMDNASLFASYTNGASPGNAARVANFITQERNAEFVNRPHPTVFSPRQARWLMEEMRGGAPAASCAAFCGNGPGISGAESVCGASTTYSTALIGGATYRWTVSSNLKITSGQNTSSIGVSLDGSGNAWIQVAITSPCRNLTIRRDVRTGTIPSEEVKIYKQGSSADPITAPIWAAPGTVLHFEAPYFANVVYQWKIVSPHPGYTIGSNSRYLKFQMFDTPNKVVTIILTVTNACGTSGGNAVSITNSMNSYSMSPNPATDEITIEASHDMEATNPTPESLGDNEALKSSRYAITSEEVTGMPKTFEVIIYDQFSQVRKTAKTKMGRLTIPTKDLPNGLYQVLITYPGGSQSKHLLVQH